MKIIDYENKYKSEIDRLQKMQWGEGSDSDEIINNLDNYKIKLVESGGKICGACIWHLTENQNCYLDFIVLMPKCQHLGLGKKLMQMVIDYAKQNGCEYVECEAIDACGKMNAKNLLDSTGFVESEVVKNYWGNKYPDFDCKECGHKPCICTMHKYIKKIF